MKYSERKISQCILTYRFPLTENVLLDLFSLQLCLLFFLKTMKFVWRYLFCMNKTMKFIWRIFWIRTSEKNQIDVMNISKIQYIYFYFTNNTSIDFRKVNWLVSIWYQLWHLRGQEHFKCNHSTDLFLLFLN